MPFNQMATPTQNIGKTGKFGDLKKRLLFLLGALVVYQQFVARAAVVREQTEPIGSRELADLVSELAVLAPPPGGPGEQVASDDLSAGREALAREDIDRALALLERARGHAPQSSLSRCCSTTFL